MSGKLSMPSTCSIFRIPNILSRHSKTAYTPDRFSFGPFHHHDKNVKSSEKIKSKYLLDLVSRLPSKNPEDPDAILRGLTKAVASVWKEARDHYAGPIGMEADEFVEVLVLDGCFIIELFRRRAYESLRVENDPIFTMSCMHQLLWHDLILLENQIPWMVLDILFKETTTLIDKKELVQLAVEYFATIFSTTPPPTEPLLENPHGSRHILDLLRNSLISPSYVTQKRWLGWEWEAMRSAARLEESGIRFKKLNSRSVLNIRFNKRKGVLEIPTLFIQETTDTVLRNLIGLEQCCPNYDAVITSYAILLDNLIDTEEDFEILGKSKVIRTWLNADDAAKFFNKLYIDTFVKETFYLQITKDVNEYCKQPRHRYRRVLTSDYFKHPWALISVVAASIALILTFLQTLNAFTKG